MSIAVFGELSRLRLLWRSRTALSGSPASGGKGPSARKALW